MGITGQYSFMETEVHASPAGTLHNDVTLHWTGTLTGKPGPGQVLVPTVTISGTVNQSGSGSDAPVNCSGALSAKSGMFQSDLQDILNVYGPHDVSVPPVDAQTLRSSHIQDYLVTGGFPPIGNAKVVVSNNTDPSESGCNTGGLTYYAPPPQGSSAATDYKLFSVPFSLYTTSGNLDASSSNFAFKYDGPVDAPPGYTITVNEQGTEFITFALH